MTTYFFVEKIVFVKIFLSFKFENVLQFILRITFSDSTLNKCSLKNIKNKLKKKNKKKEMKLILVFFLINHIACSSKFVGELETSDYESLFDEKNAENFKSKLILLAVLNENAKSEFDNRVDVLNELKTEVEKLNANSNENQIELKAISSGAFVKKYSVFKYPQFFFFRKGNYVYYKGFFFGFKFKEFLILVIF